MEMRSLSSKQVRECFTDTLNHVACDLEHIAIKSPGKETVYMIPAKDYELFIKLLEQAEDKLDLEEAEKPMANPEQERLTFEEFLKEIYKNL
ncbi:type II toxin-antitoxin system Phd/YefM family antitoxin [Crocosphaera sp. XPORK-15E]|uniref:type II toxin-antitoxin system Phd/YefM family antitoxin n=1 Tax=Crocosphaera sp. XPORK-15E TaxID=3110247 RepID=UPI002B1F0CA7|nr:type II toxin-antitoxin system Phd/YefM family antitoxin [Crocosphaera sp. XPORK-15E]MEA5535522.1 type II toxin-antitoxin system Phd/YefM family antitoxin [Crocosphaera sp. XPORK-15E]